MRLLVQQIFIENNYCLLTRNIGMGIRAKSLTRSKQSPEISSYHKVRKGRGSDARQHRDRGGWEETAFNWGHFVYMKMVPQQPCVGPFTWDRFLENRPLVNLPLWTFTCLKQKKQTTLPPCSVISLWRQTTHGLCSLAHLKKYMHIVMLCITMCFFSHISNSLCFFTIQCCFS